MLLNYFRITFRVLWRNKIFSLLNILGLAIGMAVCMLILQYVAFETSYDQFYKKANRLYRVKTDYVRNGELIFDTADNFAGVGAALSQEIPEVLAYARLYNEGVKYNPVISFTHQNIPQEFKEKKVFFADASFIELFDLSLVQGNPQNALSEPNTVMISQEKARQYFGNANPLGKTLKINNNRSFEHLCTITGIFEEHPKNSHLKFDFLFSYKTLHARPNREATGIERFEQSWSGRDNIYTYILLQEGTSPESIEAKCPAIIDKYKPEYTEKDENGKRIRSNTFQLQAVPDIHLHSHFLNEAELPGNPQTVQFLMILAIFILVIAWMNYINLATAKSIERAREVGIRKVVGGKKSQLMKQFLFESLFLNFVALILAFLLLDISQPLFDAIIGKHFEFQLFQNVSWLILLASLFFIGSILSGLYPAFVLSSFQPIKVLKGRFATSSQGQLLRRSLVAFQFIITIGLITGTLAVYHQLEFMKNQDLGFEIEQTLVFANPSVQDTAFKIRENKLKRLKQDLLAHASISQVTQSNHIPGDIDALGLAVTPQKHGDIDDVQVIHFMFVDEDYIPTYKMNIIAGENFSKDYLDTASVIITESAAQGLGFSSAETAIGQPIYLFGRIPRVVKAVLKDFHQESLRKEANPTLFLVRPDYRQYFSVKLNIQNLPQTIQFIESKFKAILPGNPFEYFFLDDYFNRQYQADQQFGKAFTLFTFLAVFVAILGLFGLTTFSTLQRSKEIGIRKILGASIRNIFYLLTKDFIWLIFIASIIAIPCAWWGIELWLQNFAYRIQIQLWLLGLPLGLILLITFLTISYQTLKAAHTNPVNALRHE